MFGGIDDLCWIDLQTASIQHYLLDAVMFSTMRGMRE